ncbi:hypothetical protein GCM10009107_63070 [Ideonella azotifigens]|uniref:Uncharacterized protein n=1 Tax=Ideonella azotifigens TaxID=513160 RepID=A0ABN1KM37_9BURK
MEPNDTNGHAAWGAKRQALLSVHGDETSSREAEGVWAMKVLLDERKQIPSTSWQRQWKGFV